VKTKSGSILLLCAKALDKRLDDVKVSLTNISAMNVINIRYSLLKTDKNPYLLQDQEYFDALRIKRMSEYVTFSSI
jgi:hypothetical protein